MSHPLEPLDPGLRDTLGHQGRLDQFAPCLEPLDPKTNEPVRRFHWQPGVSHGQSMATGPGVLLMFQRMVPHESPGQTQWGLRGITLHTVLSPMSDRAWMQPWPANLPAHKATLPDVIAAFGSPEVNTQGLAVFALKGPQDQRWGLQCQFDETGHLQTFTVAHVDQHWQPLPESEASTTQPESPAIPITCFSGAATPKTGWYEGRLPPDHPSHAMLNQLDARFAYCKAGQPMSRLGVSNEALVVWTWIGEQRPV